MSFSKLREMVMDREAWHAAVNGFAKVGHYWSTELNWSEVIGTCPYISAYLVVVVCRQFL